VWCQRLAWCAFAAGALLSCHDASSQNLPSYLKIDGRYYATGPTKWDFYPTLRALVITDTSALACHRAGGGAVTPFGLVMYYSPSVSELQVNSITVHVSQPVIAEVTTVNGDVVCLGEVAAPVTVDPDFVFGSGFE
jgi:hypothetical protein